MGRQEWGPPAPDLVCRKDVVSSGGSFTIVNQKSLMVLTDFREPREIDGLRDGRVRIQLVCCPTLVPPWGGG